MSSALRARSFKVSVHPTWTKPRNVQRDTALKAFRVISSSNEQSISIHNKRHSRHSLQTTRDLANKFAQLRTNAFTPEQLRFQRRSLPTGASGAVNVHLHFVLEVLPFPSTCLPPPHENVDHLLNHFCLQTSNMALNKSTRSTYRTTRHTATPALINCHENQMMWMYRSLVQPSYAEFHTKISERQALSSLFHLFHQRDRIEIGKHTLT